MIERILDPPPTPCPRCGEETCDCRPCVLCRVYHHCDELDEYNRCRECAEMAAEEVNDGE